MCNLACQIYTDYDVVIKEDISNLFSLCKGATFVTNGNSKLKDMFFPQKLPGIEKNLQKNMSWKKMPLQLRYLFFRKA